MRAYYSNNRAEFLETTTESQIHNVHLEVCGDGCASGLGQVDHVFSVGLGLGGGLLGIPDRLHLGDIGAVLILSRLVGLPSFVSPPDTNQESSPPGGLDEGRHSQRFSKDHNSARLNSLVEVNQAILAWSFSTGYQP